MADDLLPLLLDLMRLPGVPGCESAVAEKLSASWGPLSDSVRRTNAGSVHATRHGQGKKPRPSILLTAHMDAVGLVVAEIEGSFLRVASAGALSADVVSGQRVLIHGRRLIPGIVVQPPEHCLPSGKTGEMAPLGAFLVDTGLGPRRLQGQVRIGDAITFDRMPIHLGEGLLCGPALDNRAGLAALTMALQGLARTGHEWDVVAVGTVQEEMSGLGARTSAHALKPAIALVIDTTYGRGHGEAEHLTFPLGGGPSNGWGAATHAAVYALLSQAAERVDAPLTIEPMPTFSETDADVLQLVGSGIPTGCVSIPVRYMHSPVEVVSLEDIRTTVSLVVEFVRGLDDAAGQISMEGRP
jgi:tetrahedral aminopeptidase